MRSTWTAEPRCVASFQNVIPLRAATASERALSGAISEITCGASVARKAKSREATAASDA